MDLLPTVLSITAIAISAGVALFVAWQERRTGELARMWDECSRLYVDLLAHQEYFLAVEAEYPYGPDGPAAWELRHSLYARVAAFASPRVAMLWAATTDSALDLHWYRHESVGDWENPTSQEEAEINQRQARKDASSDALRAQVRKELLTNSRLKWGSRSAREGGEEALRPFSQGWRVTP